MIAALLALTLLAPVTEPATATTGAVRVGVVDVPAHPATGRSCPQWEYLLTVLAPTGGWSVARMSGYMWRESRCIPDVRPNRNRNGTTDHGLLQINSSLHRWLRTALGEWVDGWTLRDPVQNVRAAAALCVEARRIGWSCFQPWGGRG